MNQESHLYSSFRVSVTRLLLTDFLAIKWTIIQYFISQARFHQLLLDTWCFGRYMNIHDRLTRLKNKHNLCSRRLEVVGERENGPARGVGRAESCSVVIKIHVSCFWFTADKFTCFGSINPLLRLKLVIITLHSHKEEKKLKQGHLRLRTQPFLLAPSL